MILSNKFIHNIFNKLFRVFRGRFRGLFAITILIFLFIAFLNFNPLTREPVNPSISNNSLTREPVNPLINNKAYAVTTQIQLDQTASILSSIQSIINKLKIDIQELFESKEVKAQADITTGLVGHWKFDEGAGTTASDSSGNNNTGTLTNGPIWTTGKVGTGALSFDGVDDYVVINDSLSLNFGSGNFSISFWMNASSIDNSLSDAIIKKRIGNTFFIVYLGAFAANGMRFWIRTELPDADAIATTPASMITIGKWYYVTAVRNNTTVIIYIDGVEKGTGSHASLGSTNNADNLIFGLQSSSGYFNGNLDDVRIYNGLVAERRPR